MKQGWRIILVIVVIAIAVGAVSAGVGVLTGADFDRIGTVIQERTAEKYNVDVEAVFQQWVPESVEIIRDAIMGQN